MIKSSNKSFIIGSDEVGCACLAGPLTICSVLTPKDWDLKGLGDSKKLTRKQRETMEKKLLEIIVSKEINYSMVDISNVLIDQNSFGSSFKAAHKKSIEQLNTGNELIVLDGNFKLNLDLKGSDFVSIIKADSKIPAVMAASILAKTHRDAIMRKLHDQFPVYGWDTNVGYPTKKHYAGMKEHGITEYHRTSFNTVLDFKK